MGKKNITLFPRPWMGGAPEMQIWLCLAITPANSKLVCFPFWALRLQQLKNKVHKPLTLVHRPHAPEGAIKEMFPSSIHHPGLGPVGRLFTELYLREGEKAQSISAAHQWRGRPLGRELCASDNVQVTRNPVCLDGWRGAFSPGGGGEEAEARGVFLWKACSQHHGRTFRFDGRNTISA